MGKFQDRVVIVTGVASGFGKAIARKFSDEGAKILGADINAKDGQQVVQELIDQGSEASFVATNIAKASDVEGGTVDDLGDAGNRVGTAALNGHGPSRHEGGDGRDLAAPVLCRHVSPLPCAPGRALVTSIGTSGEPA